MKTKVAIVYDFDKTLSTDDMQAFGFIQALGMEVDEFWNKCGEFGSQNNTDGILAYMYLTVKEMRDRNIKLTREYFYNCGKTVEFFKGVETWFDRINQFGRENGVEVEHYVVSSGLTEIIEGTRIAKYFNKIFACYFVYDESGVPVWPALALNYTNKTQFIYRINKGIFGVRDNRVNEEMSHKDRYIPFSNIIYVGDSATDIPCMRMLYKYGGNAIGLYQPGTKNEKYLKDLVARERINFATEADYSDGKGFDTIVKGIIQKIKFQSTLEEIRENEIADGEDNND